jgi:hypothetical protein
MSDIYSLLKTTIDMQKDLLDAKNRHINTLEKLISTKDERISNLLEIIEIQEGTIKLYRDAFDILNKHS